MKIKSQLINEETGEVLVESENNFTNSMTDEGYRIPSHKMGARMFSNVPFPAGMTDAEIGKMARLAKLMVSKTNMLGYRDGRGIQAYTAGEIAELAGLGARRGIPFVNKMLRLHVLQKVVTSAGASFYINPAYFMANGQRLSLDLFLLFREELKGVVPVWAMNEFLQQAHEKQLLKSDVQAEADQIIDKARSVA